MIGTVALATLCVAVATLSRDSADGWDLILMVPVMLLASSALLRAVVERVANRVLCTYGERATPRHEEPPHDAQR